MKRILVTTDFSANSKAGLRFAIQLAAQNNYQLTFFHVYQMLRPTSWNDAVFISFENSEHKRIKERLYKFVSSLYDATTSVEGFDFVIEKHVSPERCIRQYAEENHYDYICLSRNGTGKTAMLFGGTVSALIKKSKVPVIAVPETYKRRQVKHIIYASDLANLEPELKQVTDFSVPLKARVELLHFKVPIDYLMQSQQFESISRNLKKYNIAAQFNVLNYEETLIANMNKILKQTNPDMVIMFTKQKRSWFEKLFLSSMSAEYSFLSKRPLLVIKKDQG